MEIPLNAQVECTDGICGRSEYVLIDPLTDDVTHLVVKQDSSPNTEYIVPVKLISETVANTLRLRCSKADLEKMHPFIKTEYVEKKVPVSNLVFRGGIYGAQSYYYLPYVTSEETVRVPVKHQQIPAQEHSVRRGTRVKALDGYVGTVDEFVVNPKNGHITHLVMRKGHLWGKKDVIIPLSAMGKTVADTVFLKLNKHQIESLPTLPLFRRWS
jgi:sporulation protein YlmC with PRC-barrel domain